MLAFFTKEINHDTHFGIFAHYEGSKCYNWSPRFMLTSRKILQSRKGKLDGQADGRKMVELEHDI